MECLDDSKRIWTTSDFFLQSRLIVAQMSNTRCEGVHWMTPFIVISIVISLFVPLLERPLLYILCILTTAAHWHYGTRVVSATNDIFWCLYVIRSTNPLKFLFGIHRCNRCATILDENVSRWHHHEITKRTAFSEVIEWKKYLRNLLSEPKTDWIYQLFIYVIRRTSKYHVLCVLSSYKSYIYFKENKNACYRVDSEIYFNYHFNFLKIWSSEFIFIANACDITVNCFFFVLRWT